MVAKKLYIKASSNKRQVKIPEEFIGKNVVVSFLLDEQETSPVNPIELLGIMNVPKQSLEELRAERLNLI